MNNRLPRNWVWVGMLILVIASGCVPYPYPTLAAPALQQPNTNPNVPATPLPTIPHESGGPIIIPIIVPSTNAGTPTNIPYSTAPPTRGSGQVQSPPTAPPQAQLPSPFPTPTAAYQPPPQPQLQAPYAVPQAPAPTTKYLMIRCDVFPLEYQVGKCFIHDKDLSRYMHLAPAIQVGVLCFDKGECIDGLKHGASWVAYNPEKGHSPQNEVDDPTKYACDIARDYQQEVVVGTTFNNLPGLRLSELKTCGVDGIAVQLQKQLDRTLTQIHEYVDPINEVGFPIHIQLMEMWCSGQMSRCHEIFNEFMPLADSFGAWPSSPGGTEIPGFLKEFGIYPP